MEEKDEIAAARLRKKLLRIRQLKLVSKQDLEDSAHDVIVRILEEARLRDNDSDLAAAFNSALVETKSEAVRSENRRRYKRNAAFQYLDEGVKAELAASSGVDKSDFNELVETVRSHLRLSKEELELFEWQYVRGLEDNKMLANQLNVNINRLYKLRNTLRTKLAKIPSILRDSAFLHEYVRKRRIMRTNARGQAPVSGRVI